MLRISKLADYAAVVLGAMAERPGQSHTAVELAVETGVSQPTASKLLKMLARAGLVASQRGAHGGYALARPPARITAIDVIEAVEGPLAMTECTLASGLCDLEPTCHMGSQWQRLSAAIRRALAHITLADLVGKPLVPEVDLHLRPSHGVTAKDGSYGNA